MHTEALMHRTQTESRRGYAHIDIPRKYATNGNRAASGPMQNLGFHRFSSVYLHEQTSVTLQSSAR